MVKYSLIYFAIIVLFSVIYGLIYLHDTSSFIIEKQFNQKTYGILEIRDKLDEDENMELNHPSDITEFLESITPLYMELNRINGCIDSTDIKIKSTSTIIDSIQNVFSESREKDINCQLEIYVKAEQKSLDSIRQIIDILLKKYPDEGETIAITSGLYVQEAQMDYALLSKKVKFHDWVLKNFSGFGDKALSDTLSYYYKIKLELDSTCFELKQKLISIKSEILNENQKFHIARLQQVTYWDFLYFSFTTGFSNNFGDIVPNSTMARIAVTFHVFISIIFIAILLDAIVKRFGEHRRE